MRRVAWAIAGALGAATLAGARGASTPTGETADAALDATLAGALPADGRTDLVLIDRPSVPGAPCVRAATAVAATTAAVKGALLDPAHYPALIPSLVRSDGRRDASGALVVDWELEVPLFNLSGRFRVRERPDGVSFELFDGDFAPGRIQFTASPRAAGGSTLVVDAELDVQRSSWLLRRIIRRSPVGEPAALAAAIYVALRATAARAEHPTDARAFRPTGAMGPPPDWRPDSSLLATAGLAGLRARGSLAEVTRGPADRLAGVAVAVPLRRSPAAAAGVLADPSSWRAFPGWRTIRSRPGPRGTGAEVEDDLALVDFDAIWIADSRSPPRWTAAAGDTRGARLGWRVFSTGGTAPTLAALELYPRLEATGMVGRRFIAAEPWLEGGLALALAFVDATAMATALDAPR